VAPTTHHPSPITQQPSPITQQPSPITQQPSPQVIFHFDFYRIKKIEEVYDMGYEDYFYSGSLCFIEWPELIEELLPEDAVKVTISQQTDGQRIVTL
jgi:tRNA threonylcarbamoyladenosine biosynthesis protein TsaE